MRRARAARLELAQAGGHGHARRANGRQQAADHADDDRNHQPAPDQSRGHLEVKHHLGEVLPEGGHGKIVEVTIDAKYATSFWDEGRDKWISEKDTYDVLVGSSSASTPLKASFDVEQTRWWNGL